MEFARHHLIISQGSEQGDDDAIEHLAVSSRTNPCAIFNTSVRLGRPIHTVVCNAEGIARVIDEAYGKGAPQKDATPDEVTTIPDPETIDRLIAEADRDLLSTQGKGRVVRLVDAILFDALGRGASDVHVQPLPSATLIRYRLDGVLHTVRRVDPAMIRPLISRIKVMGRMDIAERRLPQDGRAGVTIGERPIDLRISTLPTSYGERAVIRLLDNSQQLCDLEALGMPDDVREPFLACATRSHGIILVTGPTGSGKTTTLYSTLRRIGSPERNIVTIEDPIEYELSALSTTEGAELAISQSQINERKGVNFATGLRHILRQDPDVVMIGEIRDIETAHIALQSSLTGHLVFSTLHTNDAASAVTRLIDLGVEPYLVSASISAVVAQRLVRTLHVDCHGRGCDTCLKTGFRGRTGLFELLVVDESIREMIGRSAPLQEIRRAVTSQGSRPLADEGRRLIREGRTTAAEVRRVVQG